MQKQIEDGPWKITNAEILLNQVHQSFESKHYYEGMEKLICGLKSIREHASRPAWDVFSSITAFRHPVAKTVYRDPLTRRAFQKPRGYAGDAILIDHIYFPEKFMQDADEIGREIYAYTSQSPSCQAVRNRRLLAAELIDTIALKKHKPRIFSLACGHLREAEVAKAFQENKIKDWIVMDYDRKSLEEVQRCYGHSPAVKIINLPVKDLMNQNASFNHLDFIYSMGLFDYIQQPIARNLTARLFEMLSSGGTLLISNFLPEIKDIGYMETYMDWPLIYRNRELLEDLMIEIPSNQIANTEISVEDSSNIMILKITRA